MRSKKHSNRDLGKLCPGPSEGPGGRDNLQKGIVK